MKDRMAGCTKDVKSETDTRNLEEPLDTDDLRTSKMHASWAEFGREKGAHG